MHRHRSRSDDTGAVLLLTLVVVLILGAVVLALARHATTNLTFGNNTADAALRTTAADGALEAAIDVIAAGGAPCLYANGSAAVAIPGLSPTANGMTPTVTCRSFDGAIDAPQHWSGAITGDGLLPNGLVVTETETVDFDGPLWVSDLDSTARSDIVDPIQVTGPLVHASGVDCPITPADTASDVTFTAPRVDRPVCVPTPWTEQPSFDDPPLPAGLSTLPAAPPFVDEAGCRVYRPGVYDDDAATLSIPDLPDVDGIDAYFTSGNYVFTTTGTSTAGWSVRIRNSANVIAGRHPTITPAHASVCTSAPSYLADATDGATFYLSNRARLLVESFARLEMMPRTQSGNDATTTGTRARTVPVSVQALCGSGIWCDGSAGYTASAHTLDPLPGGGDNLNVVRSNGALSVVFNGLVYVPLGAVRFESPGTDVELNGGIVAGRLWSSSPTSVGVAPAAVVPPPAPIDVIITATVADGSGTTRMQANVTYDPAATDPDDRVVVTAWNLCDPAGC